MIFLLADFLHSPPRPAVTYDVYFPGTDERKDASDINFTMKQFKQTLKDKLDYKTPCNKKVSTIICTAVQIKN